MKQSDSGRPFHRLVVETPYLEWTDSSVLRADFTEVRFVLGTVRGELVEPIEQVQLAPDHFAIIGGGGGQREISGRFIEIVTSGTSLADAELRAYSILGLVALCVGEHAIGRVRFSESSISNVSGQEVYKSILTHSYTPQTLYPAVKSFVHDRLPTIFGLKSTKKTECLVLALRWYEHGLRATGPVDAVLSHFIGIEKILAAYGKQAKIKSSLAAIESDAQFQALLARWKTTLGPNQTGRFINLLSQPSNAERFAHYAKHHRLPDRLTERFLRVLSKRNEAIHQTTSEITDEHAEDAKTVLRALLRSELSMPPDPTWGEGPFRHRADVRWDQESGWVVTPTIDWETRLELTIPPYPPTSQPPSPPKRPRPTRRKKK